MISRSSIKSFIIILLFLFFVVAFFPKHPSSTIATKGNFVTRVATLIPADREMRQPDNRSTTPNG